MVPTPHKKRQVFFRFVIHFVDFGIIKDFSSNIANSNKKLLKLLFIDRLRLWLAERTFLDT